MKIIINRQDEVNVTPELLAEIFWNMYANDQAEFFNHLGNITNPHDWETQIHSILNSNRLDKIGRRRMEALADNFPPPSRAR